MPQPLSVQQRTEKIADALSRETALLRESMNCDATNRVKIKPHLFALDQQYAFIFDADEQKIIKNALLLIADDEPNLELLADHLDRICSILKTERMIVQ